jgi:hypothetical protein
MSRQWKFAAALAAVATAAAVAPAVIMAPPAAAGPPGWALQTTQSPASTLGSPLQAVSCPSATACLAVGFDKQLSHRYLANAEAWNGTNWAIVTPGEPPSAGLSNLAAVSCTSATACTAVGYYKDFFGTHPLAERWNGTGWTVQLPPSPAGSTQAELAGVSCVSATACTTVGWSVNTSTGSIKDLAEFWDGSNWTIQATQAAFSKIDYALNAVSCSSAADCLAVGHYVSHFSTGQRIATWAEHWNGSNWSGVLPDVASSYYNDLLGVSCTAATACTAVGYSHDLGGMNFPLAERWNGTSWTMQFPEFPASSSGTVLNGVSCASATACMAVGDAAPPIPGVSSVTLAESWDGASWTLGSPLERGPDNSLGGVSCPSAAVCTAVGWWDATGTEEPLAERYS